MAERSNPYASPREPTSVVIGGWSSDGPPIQQPGWGFWLLWVTSSLVTVVLHEVVIEWLTPLLPPGTLLIRLGFLPLVALVHGAIQWLILRRWFRNAGWWVPACGARTLFANAVILVGWNLSINFGFVMDPQKEHAFFLFCMAIAGTIGPIPEWLVLRRWIKRAGWWVLANAVGWVVDGQLGPTLEPVTGRFAASLIVNVALAGATGLLLLHLIRRDRQLKVMQQVEAV